MICIFGMLNNFKGFNSLNQCLYRRVAVSTSPLPYITTNPKVLRTCIILLHLILHILPVRKMFLRKL